MEVIKNGLWNRVKGTNVFNTDKNIGQPIITGTSGESIYTQMNYSDTHNYDSLSREELEEAITGVFTGARNGGSEESERNNAPESNRGERPAVNIQEEVGFEHLNLNSVQDQQEYARIIRDREFMYRNWDTGLPRQNTPISHTGGRAMFDQAIRDNLNSGLIDSTEETEETNAERSQRYISLMDATGLPFTDGVDMVPPNSIPPLTPEECLPGVGREEFEITVNRDFIPNTDIFISAESAAEDAKQHSMDLKLQELQNGTITMLEYMDSISSLDETTTNTNTEEI